MANALTAIMGGTTVAVLIDSASINDTANGRSTASITVTDSVAYTLTQGQAISISTTNEGTLFAGYVDTISTGKTSLIAGNIHKFHAVTCKDGVWLAQKRIYIGAEYVGRSAGDIVTDLHLNYLSAEGVSALYAADYDHDSTTLGAGILTGTTAATGTLELAKAGTTYTDIDTSQADWNTGTLTGVQSNSDGTLTLLATNAIRLTGTAASNIGGNLYHYRIIWNGAVTIASGDYLKYDLWISSTNPEISGGIDVTMTDGTTMRDHKGGTGLYDMLDQNQIRSHPNQVLSTLANDQWYTRTIDMTNIAGKVTSHAYIALEGDKDGTYTIYVRNARIYSSTNTVKGTIYAGGASMNTNQTDTTNGYYGTDCRVVKTYEATGNRITANNSLAAVGCIKNSIISWTAIDGVQGGNPGNYAPQVQVQSSTDDTATYQDCTNLGPIPNLPNGQTLAKNLTVKQILSVSGPNPEISPVLKDCTVTVAPSYTPAAKTDVYRGFKTSTDFGTGTLTNVTYDSQMPAQGQKITGQYRDWDDGNIASQTVYSSDLGAPATQAISSRTLTMRSQGQADSRVQLNFAGQWQNFVAEVDVQVVDTGGNFCYGMVYRTTGWVNGRDSYAYSAWINQTTVQLGRGTNGGAATYTQIATASVTLNQGDWYHMKLVVSGTSHKIYINNVLYINATDATYSASGYLGLRISNQDTAGGNRYSAFFDNFGVMSSAFVGTRVTPSVSISACGAVEDSVIVWNTVALEDNDVVVEASLNGGSTYTQCTNGTSIPGVTPGTNVSGKSILIRTTLNTSNANYSPVIVGLSWTVVGGYTASGTRVSPVLDISPPVTAGSSSVNWTATTPTGTTVAVDVSLDNKVSWLSATNGASIPTINGAPAETIDDYTANTSASYTATFITGGAATTPTFDITNEKLSLAGGTNGLYVYNPVSAKDIVIDAILSQSNSGGILFRYTDANNFYWIRIYDDQGLNPNKIIFNKRVTSTNTLAIAQGTINFSRGTYHALKISCIGTTITVLFDGVQMISLTDSSLSASGKAGYFNDTGTAIWTLLQLAPQGDNLAGKTVYSRVTLTSSDPGVTPDLNTLAISVRSTDIDSGAVIPATSYRYQKTVAECIDDVAGKSGNIWWNIDRAKKLKFQTKPAVRAPWALNSTDVQFATQPKLRQASPAYRNRQYVIGGINSVHHTVSRIGNGFTTAWVLEEPIDTLNSVILRATGVAYTVGIRGVDTGRDFYYKQGEAVLSQDTTATPLDDGVVIDIDYNGQEQVVAVSNNVSQQTALAAIDGTSGIVEKTESIPGLSQAAAQQVADARISQYAILSRDWKFTTTRAGLQPGHLLSVFVPEYNLLDQEFLVTDVTITIRQATDTSGNPDVLILYDVSCTDGTYLGHWTELFIRN
jgi:hypothetical protein